MADEKPVGDSARIRHAIDLLVTEAQGETRFIIGGANSPYHTSH